jgi:hypothetical protein
VRGQQSHNSKKRREVNNGVDLSQANEGLDNSTTSQPRQHHKPMEKTAKDHLKKKKTVRTPRWEDGEKIKRKDT